ncbi:MAG: glucosaminidase domain-containing protein [Rhodobacteraceae bacterium]|nr:glucosaminidase domain-containing protein [Paracoccaceae bacterium]
MKSTAFLFAEAAIFAAILAIAAIGPPPASAPPVAVGWTLRIASTAPTVADLESAFAAIDYDFRAIRDGERPVPRVRVDTMPEDLSQVPEVARRKSLFFASVLPLILAVNEQIAHERELVEGVRRKLRLGEAVTDDERQALTKIAHEYEVIDQDALEEIDVTSTEILDRLDRRVAPIPVSLALAQAAEESAWGMSRFAVEGNAIFGQWVWNDDAGIVPELRDTGARHSIRAFKDLYESTRVYAHNLNTHWAYRDFRRARATMLSAGALNGQELAATLLRYSERGQAYVEALRKIIRGNGLAPLDDARFSSGQSAPPALGSQTANAGPM